MPAIFVTGDRTQVTQAGPAFYLFSYIPYHILCLSWVASACFFEVLAIFLSLSPSLISSFPTYFPYFLLAFEQTTHLFSLTFSCSLCPQKPFLLGFLHVAKDNI